MTTRKERQATEVARALKRGLTVADLIAELENCDPEAKVVFTCDYGDYHHTEQALPVAEVEDDSYGYRVGTSAYSQSGLELVETDGYDGREEGSEEEEEEQPKIVVLRHKSR